MNYGIHQRFSLVLVTFFSELYFGKTIIIIMNNQRYQNKVTSLSLSRFFEKIKVVS